MSPLDSLTIQVETASDLLVNGKEETSYEGKLAQIATVDALSRSLVALSVREVCGKLAELLSLAIDEQTYLAKERAESRARYR